MTSSEWLKQAQKRLELAGIGTARLDALVLLEDELNKSRTHLLAHPEIELFTQNLHTLGNKLARRERHEPLAYIRGHTEFYGREFFVTPSVLIPRPESETMIDLLKKYRQAWPEHSTCTIADVGTGCGALGITAKLELPDARIDLLEIELSAIKVAKMNVIKFATGQNVIRSNLLSGARQPYDILLCNLPYVPDDFRINEAAKHEPDIAIFGGSDGLDLYRRLFAQIKKLQIKTLLILCESLPSQHSALERIAQVSNYEQKEDDDFIQVFQTLT